MTPPAPPPRIAVVGVSSLIGEAVLEELRARKVPHAHLFAVDEERDIGRPLAAADDAASGEARQVIPVAAFDFSGVDLAIF